MRDSLTLPLSCNVASVATYSSCLLLHTFVTGFAPPGISVYFYKVPWPVCYGCRLLLRELRKVVEELRPDEFRGVGVLPGAIQ